MNAKRICSFLLALAVLAAAGLFVVRAAEVSRPASVWELGGWLDRAVSDALRGKTKLDRLAPALFLRGGEQERNGLILADGELIENIPAGDEDVISANTEGILRCLETFNRPAAVMLLPTAAAIRQQKVPLTAELYNQKAMIASVYERVSGAATTVDAYTALFSVQDEYLYYRTASNLTGLGGYYVYTALAPRLGLSAASLSDYEIENLPDDYRGDLSARAPDAEVRPDLISLYRYTRTDRTYRVICTRGGASYVYNTLFPMHLRLLGRPEDVLFGGAGERLEISVAAQRGSSLLLYADETAVSYLPFLAPHYRRITVVDPRKADEELLSAIDPAQYDRVIFACSVRTFSQEPIYARLAAD